VAFCLLALVTLTTACASIEESGISVEIEAPAGTLSWEPQDMTVPVGIGITITARNLETFGSHDLVIVTARFVTEADARTTIARDPSLVVAETGLIGPEQSSSLTVRFGQPGVYQFLCSVPGHFSGGMYGTITVKG
jgi:uncharacterized cupredoxin-like copper-binding protein